jgi:RsiW-degrading membrane proteinase PrsW (M82 family)
MGTMDEPSTEDKPGGVAAARSGAAEQADERTALAERLGPRAKRFLRVYDRRIATGRRYPISWCWAGLFLNDVWALYRRLYGPALVAGSLKMLASAVIAAMVQQEIARPLVMLALIAPVPLFFALFGRALVVESTLLRMGRPSPADDAPGTPPSVTGLPTGPLRGLMAAALLVFAAHLAAKAMTDLPRLFGGRGGGASPPSTLPASEVEAVLTGIPVVDRPLGMLLVNGLVLVVIALGCRFLRRRSSWPALAAVAIGGFGTLFAAMLPYPPLMDFLLPTDPQPRLLVTNYLFTGPIEEAAKLGLLLALVRRWEPVRDPKTVMVAALLVGAGFALLENFLYLHTPAKAGFALVARLLLPFHVLAATIIALGVYGFLRTGRVWPLALAWLGAALAHGAFNHSVIFFEIAMNSYSETEAAILSRELGVDLAVLRGLPRWPALLEAALLTSTLLATACAVGRLLRRPDAATARPPRLGVDTAAAGMAPVDGPPAAAGVAASVLLVGTTRPAVF